MTTNKTNKKRNTILQGKKKITKKKVDRFYRTINKDSIFASNYPLETYSTLPSSSTNLSSNKNYFYEVYYAELD